MKIQTNLLKLSKFYCAMQLMLIFVTTLLSSDAFAWGNSGHQITGHIANSLLIPEVRARLNAIIPAINLAEVSTWMDTERLHLKQTKPGSNKWHYIDQSVCANQALESVCPEGDCIVDKITQYWKILGDENASQEDKAFAVHVLVHMVGDIHQPLHASDNDDRGGNDVSIKTLLDGSSNNLHFAWDTGLIRQLIRQKTPQEVAFEILAFYYQSDIPQWQTGTASNWANESYEISKIFVYGKLPHFSCNTSVKTLDRLPAAYIEQAIPIVKRQLAMAGARIAYVLNSALISASTKPQPNTNW